MPVIKSSVLLGEVQEPISYPVGQTGGGGLGDDIADILGFIGFAFGLIGAGFSMSLLIFIGAIIAFILVIDLVLDYLAIDQKCEGLSLLVLLAVLASIIGISLPALLSIVVMYTALLAGYGAVVTANSSVCKN